MLVGRVGDERDAPQDRKGLQQDRRPLGDDAPDRVGVELPQQSVSTSTRPSSALNGTSSRS